jgi:Eukaryotic rRNA processing protein EBP2
VASTTVYLEHILIITLPQAVHQLLAAICMSAYIQRPNQMLTNTANYATHKQTGGANKRAAKDKKYGHGGVPGRLKKQATSKSINDMRGFNPKQDKTGAKKVYMT